MSKHEMTTATNVTVPPPPLPLPTTTTAPTTMTISTTVASAQNKFALVYEPDQWSPLNRKGHKRYTRQQLLLLRMQPQSQMVPKCKVQLGVLARINLMPMFAKKSMLHPHEQHPQQSMQQQRRPQQQQHPQNMQQQLAQQQQHGAQHHQHHHHNQHQQYQQQQQQHGSGNTMNNSCGSNNNTGKKNLRNPNRNSGAAGGACGSVGGGNAGAFSGGSSSTSSTAGAGSSSKGKNNESKETKSEIVHITLTPKENVKLNEAENAWKPRVLLAAVAAVSPLDVAKPPPTMPDQCDELYKRVRSILNKLTFDNFDVLLEQLTNSAIDSMDKLNGVILLVFDKAIDEPKFSRAYAQLCKSLVENCFPVDSGSRKLFKTTLINKCQREFERNVTGGTEGNAEAMRPLREELAACTAVAERRAGLTATLVETEQRLRRRTVCTVGFIGELYRMEMLTTKIINWCVRALLDSRSEEKLECLCKLLATVGEKIETKANDEKVDDKNYVDLSEYFRQLQQIVERKNAKMKVSNRVRFMLQDIIDLRNNKWVSRQK